MDVRTHARVIEAEVSFGDCDPAGIVWYPRIAGWMDRAFHAMMRAHGGHGPVCARLGAHGVGVVELGLSFRAPLRDGDRAAISLAVESWSRRTFRLRYEGRVGGRPAFEGFEVRALFVPDGAGGLRAGEVAPLREVLDG
jgi:4-hydroxybenzoyl-CoA thioesterase